MRIRQSTKESKANMALTYPPIPTEIYACRVVGVWMIELFFEIGMAIIHGIEKVLYLQMMTRFGEQDETQREFQILTIDHSRICSVS
jgi:hypothetical protein